MGMAVKAGAPLPHSKEALLLANDGEDSIRGGLGVCEDARGVAAGGGAWVGGGNCANPVVAAAEDAEDGGI